MYIKWLFGNLTRRSGQKREASHQHSGDEIARMLRSKALKREEMMPSFLPYRSFSRVTVEPRDAYVRGTVLRDRWQRLASAFWKVAMVLTLASPVVFILTWNHLFGIDAGARPAMTDPIDSSRYKTFTVR